MKRLMRQRALGDEALSSEIVSEEHRQGQEDGNVEGRSSQFSNPRKGLFLYQGPIIFSRHGYKIRIPFGLQQKIFLRVTAAKHSRILTEFLDWALLASDGKTQLTLRLGTRKSITSPCSIGTEVSGLTALFYFILLICFICTYFILLTYLLYLFYCILLFSQELFLPSKERMEKGKHKNL